MANGVGGFVVELADVLGPVLPPGFEAWAQVWVLDAGGPAGFAASNAISDGTWSF